MQGLLIHCNTMEDFKSRDKKARLQLAADLLYRDIADALVEADPIRLSPFIVYIYADLKQYVFHYWFAFLALVTRIPCRLTSCRQLGEVWSREEVHCRITRGRGGCYVADPSKPIDYKYLTFTDAAAPISLQGIQDTWFGRNGKLLLAD
jgi:hypothetical protein